MKKIIIERKFTKTDMVLSLDHKLLVTKPAVGESILLRLTLEDLLSLDAVSKLSFICYYIDGFSDSVQSCYDSNNGVFDLVTILELDDDIPQGYTTTTRDFAEFLDMAIKYLWSYCHTLYLIDGEYVFMLDVKKVINLAMENRGNVSQVIYTEINLDVECVELKYLLTEIL